MTDYQLEPEPTPTPADPPLNPVDKVLMVRRTMAPMVWAAGLLLLAEWGIDLGPWAAAHPATVIVIQTLLSAVIYLVAIVGGKWMPWLEKVLLTSSQRPNRYVEN